FSRYPRTLAADSRICEREGANAILAFRKEEMYPAGYSTYVNEEALSGGLCGASRPGHFRGVTTVVAKLFNLVQPDIAVFGQKDWQQLAIVRRMVRDLNFPLRIAGVPTVREADGLALSSRNQYLTPAERAEAPKIHAALGAARRRAKAGEKRAGILLRQTRRELAKIAGGELDYLELVDAETLEPVSRVERTATLAVAFKFGGARLIDNVQLK
ncbi:MAG TPA: pantoate--beta-alanine ligase, partial [Chthoniobacterales bacterium]